MNPSNLKYQPYPPTPFGVQAPPPGMVMVPNPAGCWDSMAALAIHDNVNYIYVGKLLRPNC